MIRLIKSTFYNENKTKEKLCKFIMEAKRLSMSEKCKAFEEDFSKYQGRKYSVLFNSGSSANLALIQALINLERINKEDVIGFSALTWATNVMPLLELGCKVQPLDAELENLNVSSEILKNMLKVNKINVLFITNLLGFSADLDKIYDICEKHNILLLEDNCEALGSVLKGKKLGNFSHASTFSFFVGHHMSTIEGGMVCTDDEELYKMLMMVRAHGWARDLKEEDRNNLMEKHNTDNFYDVYSFYYPGYNLRPTEITGFLGCEQLKYIEEITKKREENFKIFQDIATTNDDFFHLDMSHMDLVSNFAFPVVCKKKELFIKYKDRFIKNNVEIRPVVGGSIVTQPFFEKHMKNLVHKGDFNNAEIVNSNGFYFGNNPEMTNEEIEKICGLLKR